MKNSLNLFKLDTLGSMWKNHIDMKMKKKNCAKKAQQEGWKFMAQYSAVNTIKYLKIDYSL